MMTSQTLKFVGLSKPQESKYLVKEKLFFFSNKKIIHYTLRYNVQK